MFCASIGHMYISHGIGAYIDGWSLSTSLKVNHRGHICVGTKIGILSLKLA